MRAERVTVRFMSTPERYYGEEDEEQGLDLDNLPGAQRARIEAATGEPHRSPEDLTFPPKLAFEVALDIEELEVLFARYGLQGEEAVALAGSSVFAAKVREYKTEIVESGVSFRLKAKLQAEDLLTTSYHLARDPLVPAAVRADLIQWTAKMADLEPAKKDPKGGGGGGAPFQLNITFHGAAGPVAITSGEPAAAIIDGTAERVYDDND